MRRCRAFLVFICLILGLLSCSQSPHYDLLIRNGTIYDGSGGPAIRGDIAVNGDRIAAIGDLGKACADREVDAAGMAVAPGFINMLSWASESLIEDGRCLSDIVQGVTLEVMGEGWSMGPLNDSMKETLVKQQGDIKYDIQWTSLGDYLDFLERKGIAANVASFVGAATVRIHELGYENRAPSEEELARMCGLVDEAMEEGALGVGSSLIYAPAFYAETEELIALCRVAAKHGGMYISHMRSEGSRLLESLDELIRISREAGLPAEIYHLKMAGEPNWDKYGQTIAKIEAARAEGLRISADMYTYTAGATGLNAAMPPWVQEGGFEAWAERLQDPETRARVAEEMGNHTDDWENFYHASGPERMLLIGFKNEELKHLTGKTLAEVAAMRGTPPEETAMDLVVEDGSRVGTIYFLMNEENVRLQIALPWMSFGSDADAPAPEGAFLKSSRHPRTYGNFARLLGKYVRDEGVITLTEAVRRLTAMPADNLSLKDRGRLNQGYFADIVIFDPAKVRDLATFEKPHQLSEGMIQVFVNGVQVLKDGVHTGALPGRAVRGPGYSPPKP